MILPQTRGMGGGPDARWWTVLSLPRSRVRGPSRVRRRLLPGPHMGVETEGDRRMAGPGERAS